MERENISNTEDLLVREATPGHSSITENNKYEDYLKDLKQKKNVKLKYLKDFLSSFHQTAGPSSNHRVGRKSGQVLEESKSKENIKPSTSETRKVSLARNSTICNTNPGHAGTMQTSLNSTLDLDYLTKRLEGLQKSNSTYHLPLSPVHSSTSPVIKAPNNNKSSSKSKKLADVYLSDYKFNNKSIYSNKKETRPVSNLEAHFANSMIHEKYSPNEAKRSQEIQSHSEIMAPSTTTTSTSGFGKNFSILNHFLSKQKQKLNRSQSQIAYNRSMIGNLPSDNGEKQDTNGLISPIYSKELYTSHFLKNNNITSNNTNGHHNQLTSIDDDGYFDNQMFHHNYNPNRRAVKNSLSSSSNFVCNNKDLLRSNNNDNVLLVINDSDKLSMEDSSESSLEDASFIYDGARKQQVSSESKTNGVQLLDRLIKVESQEPPMICPSSRSTARSLNRSSSTLNTTSNSNNNSKLKNAIVIRREKSSTMISELGEEGKSDEATHSSNRLTQHDLSAMKQSLMASILNLKDSSALNTGTTTTTSGIDSSVVSPKDSTASTVSTASSSSHANSDMNDDDKPAEISQYQPARKINQLAKMSELKNRVFMMEIELSSERKKLAAEREDKEKVIKELKNRYENEKLAAMKALEARLNAERLIEINKLKEKYEFDKKNELDAASKAYEAEILSLKLKVREKSENSIMSLNNNMIDLREQNQKLSQEIKELRESKGKLEALYKIKCKADLNKSAEIKKLEISYQNELIKLRNDFNLDPIRYLENQLNVKSNQLNELTTRVSNNLSLLNGYLATNPCDLSTCCVNTIAKFKEYIRDVFQSECSRFQEKSSQQAKKTAFDSVGVEQSMTGSVFRKNPIKLVSNEYDKKNDLTDKSSNSSKFGRERNQSSHSSIDSLDLVQLARTNETINLCKKGNADLSGGSTNSNKNNKKRAISVKRIEISINDSDKYQNESAIFNKAPLRSS